MKNKELKELAERIGDLELELLRETSEKRRQEIEREIMFISENSDLTLYDYFALDEMIMQYVERRKVN